MPRTKLRPGLAPRTMGVGVGVTLEGDWYKLSMLNTSHSTIIRSASLLGQSKAAKKYQKELRKNIRTGGTRFGYPPVSDRYSRNKARLGGGGIMFMWTGSLMRSIKVFVNALSNTVSVGVEPGRTRRGPVGGLSVEEYARVLEEGSGKRGIPARPIFRDTWKQIGGAKQVSKSITKELLVAYRVLGIKPTISI